MWTGGSLADKTFLPSLFRLSPHFQFRELLIVDLCDAPMLVFELDFLIEFGLLRDLSLEKKADKEYLLSHFELILVLKSHNSGQHFYQAICYFDH